MMSRAVWALAAAGALFSMGPAGAENASPSLATLEAECGHGDGSACTALGYRVASERAFPPDVPRAFELWRAACTAGHLPACIPYGEMLLTGYEATDVQQYVSSVDAVKKIKPDRRKGRRVLGRACDGGLARACDILGASLLGEKRKHGDACRSFGRACAAGDAGGCWDQVTDCRHAVPVTPPGSAAKTGTRVDVRAAAFAVDRTGPIFVERTESGGEARVGRIERAGRLTWIATLPPGYWRVAGCGDGRTAWAADPRRLFRLDGSATPRAVALPTPAAAADQPPELVACLPDGRAVVARAVAGSVTDDDYRDHLRRHPGLLAEPEATVLQKIQLSVYPHTRAREIDRGRALAQRLAADLRRGRPWADVAKEASADWYAPEVVERRFDPSENPPAGAPPAEAFRLATGQVLGPVEHLEPAQSGRFERQKGELTVWRVASRVPARAPAPHEALARARSTLRARLAEVLIAAPSGAVEVRRLAVISASRVGADGQLGPLLPLDGGGFALLGDNRQVWQGGQWSTGTPLLSAIGPGPVLDVARDGARIAVLTDARVRVFDPDGHLLGEAPPSRVAAGTFYPRRIGFAGAEGLLLVSPNVNKVDVLALDDQLAIRWVDSLPVEGEQSVGQSAAFAESGLWLLTGDGSRLTAYQKRQLSDYELAAAPRPSPSR